MYEPIIELLKYLNPKYSIEQGSEEEILSEIEFIIKELYEKANFLETLLESSNIAVQGYASTDELLDNGRSWFGISVHNHDEDTK